MTRSSHAGHSIPSGPSRRLLRPRPRHETASERYLDKGWGSPSSSRLYEAYGPRPRRPHATCSRRKKALKFFRGSLALQRDGEALEVVAALPCVERQEGCCEVGRCLSAPELLGIDAMAALDSAVLLRLPLAGV